MDKYKLHQARQLQQLLLSPYWRYYEEFINSLIVDKVSTSVSKEILVGLKSSIQEVKKFIMCLEDYKG